MSDQKSGTGEPAQTPEVNNAPNQDVTNSQNSEQTQSKSIEPKEPETKGKDDKDYYAEYQKSERYTKQYKNENEELKKKLADLNNQLIDIDNEKKQQEKTKKEQEKMQQGKYEEVIGERNKENEDLKEQLNKLSKERDEALNSRNKFYEDRFGEELEQIPDGDDKNELLEILTDITDPEAKYRKLKLIKPRYMPKVANNEAKKDFGASPSTNNPNNKISKEDFYKMSITEKERLVVQDPFYRTYLF